MTELLLFRLFGPLSSWGEIAVGEVRPSAARPTRSALLGLLGAALGLRRSDDEDHDALSAGLRFAVRVDAPGVSLIDYHTVNWRRPKREVILTRADELRAPRHDLATVQSTRHYRCDAVATVAAAARTPARWSLADLRAALERPVFPLALGRKSCPPALPLGPEILEAQTLAAAFRLYDQRQRLPRGLARLAGRAASVEIAWDDDVAIPLGAQDPAALLVERRDEPLSRSRWRFAVRRERVAHLHRQTDVTKEGRDVSEPPVPG